MRLFVKEIKKFVNALNFAVVDSKALHFACYEGYCSFFAKGSEGSVVWYIENPGKFYGSVDLDRFVSFFKKLKVSEVDFQFKATKLVIKGSGVSLSLPISKGFETFQSIQIEESFDKDHSELVLKGFKSIFKSIGLNSKFNGILIDSKRVCNFDSDSLSVNYHGNSFSRVIIPLKSLNYTKSVKSVDNFFKFNNNFGINLGNNLYILFPTLDDNYPMDYMGALKLEDVEEPLADSSYYEFNRREFQDSVELVYNAVGPSELILRLTQGPGLSWKISSKSYKNVEAEKIIKSEVGEDKETCFGLNAKKLISAIKAFGNDFIRFYDINDYYIVISNENQKQLVFLLKSHI